MGGEANQVLWRGVRPVEGISGIWPARNATRIYERDSANGSSTKVLYTVPANKKLYISGCCHCSRESVAAAGGTFLRVRDSGAVVKAQMSNHYYDVAGQLATTQSFMPAIEALTTYDVALNNSHANIDSYAAFWGWLEDA